MACLFFFQAQRHVLVVARYKNLDWLEDVRKEHLPLLKAMHTVALRWIEKFLSEDSSLMFRLGYHSVWGIFPARLMLEKKLWE